MQREFDGEVAIVTGGARGLGLAITGSLLHRGASVTVLDLDAEAPAELDALVGGAEARLRYQRADVSDEASFAGAIAGTVERTGRLDILVNNAGVGQMRTGILETSMEEFDRIVRVDLRGVMIGVKYAAVQMTRHGGGRIVNIASVMGLVAQPGTAAYVAAKHAVVGLTKAAALEFGPSGVRVNAVCPGRSETPMIAELREQVGFDQEQWDAEVARIHPASRRLGSPEEVAEVVAFLCSRAAANIHGVALPVDGGWVAQ